MINNKIDSLSEALTNRIIEIRFIDKVEMMNSIKTYIKTSLQDCLKLQISETERKRNEIKAKIQLASVDNRLLIQSQLTIINEQLKRENLLRSELEQEIKIKALISWMRKYHNDSLEEFFKSYNEYKIKKSEELNKLSQQEDNDFKAMKLENEALREKRIEKWDENWKNKITSSDKIISYYEVSQQGKITLDTKDYGTIDYFPKANKLLRHLYTS